jgi:hypothetical protein
MLGLRGSLDSARIASGLRRISGTLPHYAVLAPVLLGIPLQMDASDNSQPGPLLAVPPLT